SASASGRDIDNPTAHIRPPIGDRDDDTAAIRVISNAHTAPERQCFVRGGQFAIVQSATASSPCALFARGIMRCNATFGARRSDDGRERSRRKEKCLHAVDYSVEGRPTDKVDWHCRDVKALAPARCSNFTLRRDIIASENRT